MNIIKQLKFSIIAFGVACSNLAIANNDSSIYLSAAAGIFQGSFDTRYLDRTDVIPLNIGNTSQQHGYTGSIALGYNKFFRQQYLLGIELSENSDFQHANFASGSSGTTFTDTTQINNHIDLTVVPGILLNDSTALYLKLGVSYASLRDSINSPAGYTPTNTTYNSNQNVTGFASGLGIKKFLNEKFSVFAEGTYHDYGVTHFNDFENFTATYTHSAHVYSYGGVIGVAVNIA